MLNDLIILVTENKKQPKWLFSNVLWFLKGKDQEEKKILNWNPNEELITQSTAAQIAWKQSFRKSNILCGANVHA